MKRSKVIHTFDRNYLNNLVQDETACVSVQKAQQHLTLHPYQLTDLNSSVSEILDKDIAKYKPGLDGIMFGYRNVKMSSEPGVLYNETCFIHINIEAEFFIFKPVVGEILQGVVNKKSKDHIGCLVHNLFNVSLPKPEFDKSWTGDTVTLGSEISFKIVDTNFERKLPYIRGQIESVISLAPADSHHIIFDETEADEEFVDENVAIETTEKRKKNPQKLRFEDSAVDHELETMESSHTKKKKKKSKKNKKPKAEKDDDEVSLPDLNLNELFDSDVFHKPSLNKSSIQMADDDDKFIKKRKHSISLSTSMKADDFRISKDSELDDLLDSTGFENEDKKNVKKSHSGEKIKKKQRRASVLQSENNTESNEEETIKRKRKHSSRSEEFDVEELITSLKSEGEEKKRKRSKKYKEELDEMPKKKIKIFDD